MWREARSSFVNPGSRENPVTVTSHKATRNCQRYAYVSIPYQCSAGMSANYDTRAEKPSIVCQHSRGRPYLATCCVTFRLGKSSESCEGPCPPSTFVPAWGSACVRVSMTLARLCTWDISELSTYRLFVFLEKKLQTSTASDQQTLKLDFCSHGHFPLFFKHDSCLCLQTSVDSPQQETHPVKPLSGRD